MYVYAQNPKEFNKTYRNRIAHTEKEIRILCRCSVPYVYSTKHR